MNHTNLLPAGTVVPAEQVESRLLLSSSMPVVSTADLSGDGAADVIVWANARRATLASLGLGGTGVRRGSLFVVDGMTGTFDGLLPLRLRGPVPPLIASGDFNGDGQVDLVVTGQSGATRRGLNLLPGREDGTFGPRVPIAAAPAGITGLASGDFNGDGRLDLAVTTPGRTASATVEPSGAFAPTLAISGLFATRLDFADFFGDGPNAGGLARGATPPGGGGVDTAFVPQRGDFDVESRLALASQAGQTGATAEAGAAVLFNGDTGLGVFDTGDVLTDQVVVLLGSGDGTFNTAT